MMWQLKAEPDTETLGGLLDSFNEVIAHASECEAARFTPAQLQASMQVCQLVLSETMERRAERSLAIAHP